VCGVCASPGAPARAFLSFFITKLNYNLILRLFYLAYLYFISLIKNDRKQDRDLYVQNFYPFLPNLPKNKGM